MLKLSEHDAQAYARSMLLGRCSSNAYTNARTHLRKNYSPCLVTVALNNARRGVAGFTQRGERFSPAGSCQEAS